MKTFEELHNWQRMKDLLVALHAHFSEHADQFFREKILTVAHNALRNATIGHGKTS